MQKHILALSIVATVLLSIHSPAKAAIVVEFDTNVGDFQVELFDNDKPISVANFLAYSNSGLYNNSLVHRSVPDFVIQGGGFYPSGAPVPTFGAIADEIGLSNLRGTIAYANTGSPNTNVNQWFINVTDNIFLDSGFTVFGRVLGNGMDIVDLINGLPRGATGPLDGPFREVPILNPSLGLIQSNLVIVNSITTIPEPGSVALLFAGLIGIASKYRAPRSRSI